MYFAIGLPIAVSVGSSCVFNSIENGKYKRHVHFSLDSHVDAYSKFQRI